MDARLRRVNKEIAGKWEEKSLLLSLKKNVLY